MPEVLRRTASSPKAPSPTRFMLFGGGNFIRAFAAWMIELLNEKTTFEGGMLIVKPTPGRDYTELREQDGLYHVVLNGQEKGHLVDEAQLISGISAILHVYDQWEAFLQTAQQRELKYIISNTTESGIAYEATDQPTDTPPSSFPAKICLWLFARFQHFQGDSQAGAVFLPCELTANNGADLRWCILKYAEHWQLPEQFIRWVQTHCLFCNTLVDRIVTGYPIQDEAKYQEKVGFQDKLLTVGEPYHSWVIEAPAQLGTALPFQDIGLNVKWVNDLSKYREQKVKILNGAHTSMVPTGFLAGLTSVKETIDHPQLGTFIHQLLEEEVWPSLAFDRSELAEFTTKTMDRFRNPFLFHRLLDIALNSISKFRARLLPSLLDFYAQKGFCPPRISFALSALLIMYRGHWQNEPVPLRDAPEVLSFCQTLWKATANHEEVVIKFLQNEAFWGQDLNKIDGLAGLMTTYVQAILNDGLLASLTQINSSADS